jgi:hypothetical protein
MRLWPSSITQKQCWFLNADIKNQKQGHEGQSGGAGKQAGMTLKE